MRLLLILLMPVFLLFDGKPADKTQVYLEKGTQLIAFQVTGEKGKVEFDHLDAGSYRLSLVFPEQEGKYIKTKPKHSTLTKATYNPRNKTYYYQGDEGYFAIKFTGVSKIKSENFEAIFKEEHDEQDTYNIIAQFGAHSKNASIGVFVKAITAAKFKKASEKTGSDISTLSIPNIR